MECAKCGTMVRVEKAKFCPNCGTALPELPETVRTNIYLHSDKESMYSEGEELGLSGNALNNFCYAGYEVKLTLEVNTRTGDATIVAVDDRELSPVTKVGGKK